MRALFLLLFLFLFSCSNSNKPEEIAKNGNDEEMFMCFFEKFMENGAFQRTRVSFPIRISKKTVSKAKDWEHISVYDKRTYMSVLNYDTTTFFDSDVRSKQVNVVISDFKSKYCPVYKFGKKDGKWFLASVGHVNCRHIGDKPFLDYLERYSEDKAYQLKHTRFPVVEFYVNPDNSNEVIENHINRKNWTHLSLAEELQDLVILSPIDERSENYRSICYRGINNGICVKYTFEKDASSNEWFLTKMEDLSI